MATTVFVVDDSYVFRTLIKKQLHTQDYNIIAEAQNGKEALDIYKDIEPDIVIVDLKMSVMDGFELIPEIMKINPNQRILAVTTENNKKDLERIKSLGAIDALRKPFQPGFLFTRLERIMQTPMNNILKKESRPIKEDVLTVKDEVIIKENITIGKPVEVEMDLMIKENPKINLAKEDSTEVNTKLPVLIVNEQSSITVSSWDEEANQDIVIEIPSSHEDNKDSLIVENNDVFVFDEEFDKEQKQKSDEKLAELKEEPKQIKSSNDVTDDSKKNKEVEIEVAKTTISKLSIRMPDNYRRNMIKTDDEEIEEPDLSIFINDTPPTYNKVGKKTMMGKLKIMFKK